MNIETARHLHAQLPLAPGARVALVAPAGPLRSSEDVERAEENVRQLGWEPVVFPGALNRRGYLAGDDASRLAALHAALDDPGVDAIWCLRGGYGSMRLLGAIDYERWRARPLPVIGFSDVTALHHALASEAGVLGLHGPCARGELSRFSRVSMARAAAGEDSCGHAPHACALRTGTARGPLVGGNLAVLSALVGTPFLYVPAGAILVLEDVNEPVYRIDRMLRQLALSGVLARCAGVVFGAFTERQPQHGGPDQAEENSDAALDAILAEAAMMMNGPVLAGAPVGHIPEQWTWPFGGMAELDAGARRLTVLTRESRNGSV